MDLVVLRHLVAELATVLRGSRIDQAYALPRQDLAIVVSLPGSPRLWFSSEPDEPHVYLRPGGQAAPKRPPGFAMALRKRARGRCITDLRLINDDRVVELSWRGDGSRLVMELVARRASAFVVDPDDRVVAVWSPRRGRPGPGEAYRPPSARARRTRLADLDYPRLQQLPPTELRRALLREAEGMTPMVAREISARRADGQSLIEAASLECSRATAPCLAGHLYSTVPVDRLRSLPAPDALVLAAHELTSCQDMCSQRFPTLNAAATTYYTLRARLRLFDRVRRAVDQPLRARSRRLERAVGRLEAELPDATASTTLRREGDLLLAHPEVIAAGGVAQVPDDYGDGSLITIQVDPDLDLIANAQQRYRHARRITRKREHSAKRLALLRRQLTALGELSEMTQAIDEPSACDEAIGLLHRLVPRGRIDRPLEPEAGTAASPRSEPEIARRPARADVGPGILKLTTPDGDVILVGRNGAANDRLTHQVAARDDWWLHAEGPGSHVLLRNPQRLRQPPPRALERAAAVAAWFSKARSAATVEVHWTRARSVRRPKGGALGQALVEGQRSIRVRPRRPTSAGGTRQG
jgi:predicted ribosome quality control (RQC) complex YloA/Tae2 family protein